MAYEWTEVSMRGNEVPLYHTQDSREIFFVALSSQAHRQPAGLMKDILDTSYDIDTNLADESFLE